MLSVRADPVSAPTGIASDPARAHAPESSVTRAMRSTRSGRATAPPASHEYRRGAEQRKQREGAGSSAPARDDSASEPAARLRRLGIDVGAEWGLQPIVMRGQ